MITLAWPQTFTFSMKPIVNSSSNAGSLSDLGGQGSRVSMGRVSVRSHATSCPTDDIKSSDVLGFEIQIVMELMEAGSLRKLLDEGTFRCGKH